MKYNLCIPIPIKYTRIKEVKPIINKAIKTEPKLIELRFDYIPDINTLSIDFLRELLNIIHPHATVIFTFRDSSEGGQIEIEQKDRFKILKMLIESEPDYLDIEMRTNKNILSEIINLTSQKGVKLIYSYHNFEKTLAYEEGIHLIQNFNEKLIQELSLEPKILQDNIYKLIFTAQQFEDNLIPLKLCKEFSNSNQRIISFCMGTLGIFSRITCVFAGSFLTYTSLEEQTAPGQIDIKKMREIYGLILNNL
ncbi:MAG: type I 3-dehydroquinate dehydratase [Candidatus Hodarchaeota archaeon]